MTYRWMNRVSISAVVLACATFGCESGAPNVDATASARTAPGFTAPGITAPGFTAPDTHLGETTPEPERTEPSGAITSATMPDVASSRGVDPEAHASLTSTATTASSSSTGMRLSTVSDAKPSRGASRDAAGAPRTSSATSTSGTAAAPPTTVARPKVTLVSSPPLTGEGYRTYLQMPSPVAVGASATVTVHLEPQSPFKSNDKYPFRFVVGSIRGATTQTSAVTVAAVAPTRTTLQFPVTATEPGRGSVAGTFSFSVCTDEKCLVERASLVLSFEVVPDALSASPHQ